jgi:hypothetical protein
MRMQSSLQVLSCTRVLLRVSTVRVCLHVCVYVCVYVHACMHESLLLCLCVYVCVCVLGLCVVAL